MLRIIGEVQPAFIVGENVRGLLNWSRGLVFNQVQADLEAQGYKIAPLLLPACAVNAPHRRERIWFIAHAISDGYSNKLGKSGYKKEEKQREKQREKRNKVQREWNGSDDKRITIEGIITNPNTRDGWSVCGQESEKQTHEEHSHIGLRSAWQEFPTQSPVCRGNDGIPNRVDRIKSLGNAIVPQVAFEIFKAIEATLI